MVTLLRILKSLVLHVNQKQQQKNINERIELNIEKKSLTR